MTTASGRPNNLSTARPSRLSRRAFLGRATAAGAGVALAGAAGGFGVARATESGHRATESGHRAAEPAGADQIPFYGARQAGIATPAQDRLAFGAFDVTTSDVSTLQDVLAAWTAASARMTAGEPIGPTETLPANPPIDTGEAVGLSPAKLTITVGFGASIFDHRFGLAAKRPGALIDLPDFAGDALDPARTGGDLCVQACSDDPQVAFHVIRNFARIGRGVVTLRWSQLGFGRTSSTSTVEATPRNLMGFKDGTDNIKSEATAEMDRFVWVGSETDRGWMIGGSYLVTRRIRMHVETWDAEQISEQEKVFGRRRASGAPLTGTSEFEVVDLAAKHRGALVIDNKSHIRLASPLSHGGVKILRRGYSYTDGQDSTGLLDAGLFFICFNQDPRTQFVPIQRTLAKNDLLNEYITHVGSGLYAVPPGVNDDADYFGKGLFV